MQLPPTKYPNNTRAVSGTPTVYPDDVILACDTTTAPCIINLLFIPAGRWPTTWKMYIYDASNNCGVNNIIINAGSGQTINGTASVALTTNGERVEVTISSDTSFLLNAGSGFSGLPYLYVTNNLNDTSAIFPPNTSGERSYLSGTQVINWSSKVEAGVSTFNLTTGEWQVSQNGTYTISTRLVTRINDTDYNSPDDSLGQPWISSSPPNGGFVAIGAYLTRGPQIQALCSNKQWVTAFVISDINIDTTCGLYNLLAGDIIKVTVLNKTDHVIQGFPNVPALPDCIVDLMVTKIN